MSALKIVSLNVNGIANSIKRKIVFNKLKAQKADIYLLQESHSSSSTEKLWTSEWGGDAFFSHGSPNSKGVAILFDRQTDFKVLSQARDSDGRFLGMDVLVGEQTFTIASIYAPTQDKQRDQLEFLEKVDELLSDLQGTGLILGGDFNCILDPKMDRNKSGEATSQASQGCLALKSLMEEWSLMDVWRVSHPQEKEYTFRRGAYSSRLDYFLISPHLGHLHSEQHYSPDVLGPLSGLPADGFRPQGRARSWILEIGYRPPG